MLSPYEHRSSSRRSFDVIDKHFLAYTLYISNESSPERHSVCHVFNRIAWGIEVMKLPEEQNNVSLRRPALWNSFQSIGLSEVLWKL